MLTDALGTPRTCTMPIQFENLFILHFDQVKACYAKDDSVSPRVRTPSCPALLPHCCCTAALLLHCCCTAAALLHAFLS